MPPSCVALTDSSTIYKYSSTVQYIRTVETGTRKKERCPQTRNKNPENTKRKNTYVSLSVFSMASRLARSMLKKTTKEHTHCRAWWWSGINPALHCLCIALYLVACFLEELLPVGRLVEVQVPTEELRHGKRRKTHVMNERYVQETYLVCVLI